MLNQRRLKHVERCVRRYQRLLGLENWAIQTEFVSPVDENDSACYAACEALPEYHQATLSFDVAHPSFGRKEPIDRLVRHEMLHVIVSPLSAEDADFREEQVVTALERAPVWRLLEKRGKTK